MLLIFTQLQTTSRTTPFSVSTMRFISEQVPYSSVISSVVSPVNTPSLYILHEHVLLHESNNAVKITEINMIKMCFTGFIP